MSFDSEFETIYSESFLSATGTDLNAPQNKAPHDLFVEKAATEMLEAWTESGMAGGITLLSTSRDTINQHITHPNLSEFNEADIEAVARVRFLGRSAIDVAKQNLELSYRFTQLRKRNPSDIFDYFQSYFWHETHRSIDDTNDDHDPDAASPLRLADWPYGENINCLGMSIAMAAASERFGLTYVYANEIRNSQGVIAQEHTSFMRQVRRLIPSFDDTITQTVLRTIMHELREPDKQYDDILYETPHILQVHDRVRDFHHFVVCENPDNSAREAWVQVDPFDLSFDFLYPEQRQIDKALEPIFTKGNENSVVLSDEYRKTTSFYRHFDKQLQLAHDMGAEAVRRSEEKDVYKSKDFVRQLYNDIQKITFTVADNLFQKDPDAREENNKRTAEEELLDRLYLYTLLPFARKIPAAKELIEQTTKKNNHATFDTLAKGVETIIEREVGYNPVIRAKFVKHMVSLPLLYLIHTYEYNLKETIGIRDLGNATPVMELADPEFMIGAMYMNHYATWRKDGRINIARHLSRICSSQLLWQAARQDEKEIDDRVAAMGQVVKGLKPRQLHPLVNIASGIPVPTTR